MNMQCRIICVGSLKERFWQEACDEYLKRLSRFGKTEIAEVKDLPEPKNASPAQQEDVMRREGEAILKLIEPRDHVIALCVEGRQTDSLRFSDLMRQDADLGRRTVFIIGGSLGLHDAVKARADLRLSFSPMTFPHQLMRVILLEQLYRSCRIRNHEPYHK